jgi:hypothetical protein
MAARILGVLALLTVGLNGCSSGSAISVRILSPADGDTVPAGSPVPVRVEIDGGHIQGTNGEGRPGHLHLLVDRRLVEMVDETALAVTLEPGTHEITVEFAGENHESLGVLDRVDVRAE